MRPTGPRPSDPTPRGWVPRPGARTSVRDRTAAGQMSGSNTRTSRPSQPIFPERHRFRYAATPAVIGTVPVHGPPPFARRTCLHPECAPGVADATRSTSHATYHDTRMTERALLHRHWGQRPKARRRGKGISAGREAQSPLPSSRIRDTCATNSDPRAEPHRLHRLKTYL